MNYFDLNKMNANYMTISTIFFPLNLIYFKLNTVFYYFQIILEFYSFVYLFLLIVASIKIDFYLYSKLYELYACVIKSSQLLSFVFCIFHAIKFNFLLP